MKANLDPADFNAAVQAILGPPPRCNHRDMYNMPLYVPDFLDIGIMVTTNPAVVHVHAKSLFQSVDLLLTPSPQRAVVPGAVCLDHRVARNLAATFQYAPVYPEVKDVLFERKSVEHKTCVLAVKALPFNAKVHCVKLDTVFTKMDEVKCSDVAILPLHEVRDGLARTAWAVGAAKPDPNTPWSECVLVTIADGVCTFVGCNEKRVAFSRRTLELGTHSGNLPPFFIHKDDIPAILRILSDYYDGPDDGNLIVEVGTYEHVPGQDRAWYRLTLPNGSRVTGFGRSILAVEKYPPYMNVFPKREVQLQAPYVKLFPVLEALRDSGAEEVTLSVESTNNVHELCLVGCSISKNTTLTVTVPVNAHVPGQATFSLKQVMEAFRGAHDESDLQFSFAGERNAFIVTSSNDKTVTYGVAIMPNLLKKDEKEGNMVGEPG